MKILEVYKDVHPFVSGGIERYIHDLSSFLAEQGHRVTVMVAGGSVKDGTRVSGFTVRTYPCYGRLLSNPVSPGLGAAIAEENADVVHFHLPLPSAVMARLFSGWRPYVATYHSDIVRQALFLPLYGPFLRRFLARADRILATSPAYAETSLFLKKLKNVTPVPIGTDLGKFHPSPKPVDGEYALFVGRFRSYKGIEVLLEAWKRIPEEKLVMAGGGPLEKIIETTAARYSLNIQVVKDPVDDDLVKLYQGARCLLLPSTLRSEAYGMVQIEAMACGVPVISTDLPTGVPWVNRDGASGIVVAPGDPDALAEAVVRLRDPGLRYRLAEGALERAVKQFDSTSLFGRVEEILLAAGSV